MGFLGEGNTMSWEEVEAVKAYIKEHGVIQFIEIYKAMLTDPKRPHLWGDEVELSVFHVDHEKKTVELNLRSEEILNALNHEVDENPNSPVAWRPEYGVFMIEAVPGAPYDADALDSLPGVEFNMQLRRKAIEEKIRPAEGELVLSVSHFPLLGCPNTLYPYNTVPTIDACDSSFTCDEVINPHHRFGTLTKNIRVRKGRKVEINMPLFVDVNTPHLTYDEFAIQNGEERHVPGKENHVYADSMAFGMGQSCLQVTFQMEGLDDCLHVYDQLLPLTPLMLAITASTPILRGKLMDYDVRWEIISQSVDDRTDEELGRIPLNKKEHVISKSRYASVSSFLGSKHGFKKEYNDLVLAKDEASLKLLKEAGVPDEISEHLAHLFIRDPLVVYKDRVTEVDDKKDSDHFENLQSTNWQSLRFKPPPAPAGGKIGWRVEFRTMELQFTDFENAAYSCFICLMVHVIRNFLPNFYMPVSKIDENMRRAHQRDAVNTQKFWFRKDISADSQDDTISEMSLADILNGSGDFAGVIPLVHKYLESKKETMKEETYSTLVKYLRFIGERAKGTIETNATWIRKFIANHPEYKKDSEVSHHIVYDLFTTINKIQKKEITSASLYADFY